MTFNTITVAGPDALATLERLQRQWRPGQPFPFLVGDKSDLERARDMCKPPRDGGAESLQAAGQFDAATWLQAYAQDGLATQLVEGAEKKSSLSVLHEPGGILDISSYLAGQEENVSPPSPTELKFKKEVVIGSIAVQDPAEIFARLGFGGWNECPEPHVHVAVHRYWAREFGSVPAVVTGDAVECLVGLPPLTAESAGRLSLEQIRYCVETVEGLDLNELASSLHGAGYWFFWWD